MKTREQLKALAQDSYVEYMMGNPYSDEANTSPAVQLTPEERVIYREVLQELFEERAVKRIESGDPREHVGGITRPPLRD
jgi:hypothetical protein